MAKPKEKAEKKIDIRETRAKMTQKKDQRQKVLIVCGVIAALIFVVAVLNAIDELDIPFRAGEVPIQRALNFMIIGILVLMGPYGFYVAGKDREIREIEKRLPDFLRDVAEAGRFGMTLAEAIVVSSSGKYGKLTPEILKMSAQIQWGVPVTHALNLFSERLNTTMTRRIVAIINKSSEAGGNVADVLTMVSRAAKESQLMEDERSITMKTYLTVIVISYFVFLVTIWILNATFLPKMIEASTAIGEVGAGGEIQAGSVLAEDLENIIFQIQIAFFLAAIIHAIGDGILAGVLENGKIANGMKYSFIMLLSGFLILEFLV